MKTIKAISHRYRLALAGAVLAGALVGCEYDIPITASPSAKTDNQLLGEWVSIDHDNVMKVRQFDASLYVVSLNGRLFRAYHSDLNGTRFVSIQDLDSSDRKYCYRVWTLSGDGNRLTLHSINASLVPRETKDILEIQKLLRQNLKNPQLFVDETQFVRKN
jgi:hypothetical protein